MTDDELKALRAKKLRADVQAVIDEQGTTGRVCRLLTTGEALALLDEVERQASLIAQLDAQRIERNQELSSTQHRLREREEEVERLRAPEQTVVGDDEVNRVARVMMAEWERDEREPVNISRWATFADLARVVVADTVRMRRDYLYWSEQSDKWRGEYAREFAEHKHAKEQLATITRERDGLRKSLDGIAAHACGPMRNEGMPAAQIVQCIRDNHRRELEAVTRERDTERTRADANWQSYLRARDERDSAIQALSSAAEKGVAAGKLVGEAERERLRELLAAEVARSHRYITALDEACDGWENAINQSDYPDGSFAKDQRREIESLRRVGKEGK